MKRTLFLYAVLLAFLSSCTACTERTPADPDDPIEVQPTDKKDALSDAKQDLTRSLRILEAARKFYFDGKTMYRYYNPFTGTRPSEKASVWMYTSSIEAVNAFLAGISELKEAGDASLYDQYYGTWSGVLSELISGLDWYEGTFNLISYTGRADWSVYGVNRGTSPHTAAVDGINNVYDDQEWLVRELLHSYRITGEEKYLVKAEYLASYVIDGWDCTLKSDGTEHGGIVWGPGYITKHSCSNGPFISPLVRLAEHYKDNPAIQLVSISTDRERDHDKWRQMIADEKPAWSQYVMNDAENEKFSADFNIQFIPRFIIINADGTIQNADAPRPSDKNILQTLDAIIAKNKK